MIAIRTLAVIAVLSMTSVVRAEDSNTYYDCCKDKCCTCGQAICVPKCECVPREKTCYEIECKQICIPKIRFPWDKCCTPLCGKVITVKVPKAKTYECGSKLGCKWEIKPCGCGGHDGACDGAACDGGACDAALPEVHTAPESDTVPPAPPRSALNRRLNY